MVVKSKGNGRILKIARPGEGSGYVGYSKTIAFCLRWPLKVVLRELCRCAGIVNLAILLTDDWSSNPP